MDDDMIRSSLLVWVVFARITRANARRQRKVYPESTAAANSMGVARGIMLMARTMKGFHTQARFVNLRRRFA
jgi:hypothetical protein